MNYKLFCLLLTFILLQVAYTADCGLCTYSDDGKDDHGPCTPCNQGTCTQDVSTKGTDQSICIARKCQAGKKSETGYDSDGKGNGCEDCEAGTYSLEGSKACNLIPCGYGFYSETGYYDKEKGNSCEYCPADKSTNQENTIGNNDSVCTLQLNKCPEGKWSKTGYDDNRKGGQCNNCKAGTYSSIGSSHCNLIPCDYGYYSATGYYDEDDDEVYECEKQCPIGKSTKQKNTKGDNDSVCDLQLSKCPSGTWSITGYDSNSFLGHCQKCRDGAYSLIGSRGCYLKPCGYGYYSSTGYYERKRRNEGNKCTKCPADKSTLQINTQGNDDSVCVLQLKLCPEGKWSETGYDQDGNGGGCNDCQDNTFSQEGSKSCNLKPCGYGYYSATGYYDVNTQIKCVACPSNTQTDGILTKSLDNSVCKSNEQNKYADINTTSSFIIKITISSILLIVLF